VGDTITTESFYVSSVLNAVQQTSGLSTSQSLTNPTLTNPTIAAGTTTTPAVLLTSGTNLTSATAGAIEYDGKVVYGTPIGTQRGIVPTQQYYRLNATVAGADVSTAQSIFGVGVTLSASTVYEFEMVFALAKTAGTTSHTVGCGFGGTATINNILSTFIVNPSAAGSAIPTGSTSQIAVTNSVSNFSLTIAITLATATVMFVVKGVVSINAGGTFIPQYTLSAAPGGAYSTAAGSYIRINPLSASGANTSVGTWA
jgi:hypothetical protein